MFLKRFKKLITFFIVTTFIMPQTLFAYSKYILPGGENIGLQINNNGIIVAGFYSIDNYNPGLDANLQKGDIIRKVNNKSIYKIDDFIASINSSNRKNIKISFERNGKEYETLLNLVVKDDVLKTGLYVKDMVSGIGTLTYIDPNTKLYGALGHEVIESNTGTMIEVKEGKIYSSSVLSIDKSVRGEPGCKNAKIDSNNIYGNIYENTNKGIFGNYTKDIRNDKLYEVANYEEIKLGKAKMITVLNKENKKEYDINIIGVNNNINDNKNILFEVTDSELLKKTGGIVQGMSGSPIVQEGKIVGAVTNVIVNNPKKGYGILITSMLEEAEN